MRNAAIGLAIVCLAAAPSPTIIEQSSLAYPMVMHADVPLYPPGARTASVEGVVTVKVTTDGHRAIRTEVEGTANPLLSRAAEENLRTWEFTLHDPVIFTTTYRYVIADNIDSRLNNPTVVLKLPTEVEVRTLRWPGTMDFPIKHQ